MPASSPSLRIIKKLNAWRAEYFLASLFGALLECAALGFWLAAALMGAALFFELSREQRLLFEVSAALYLGFRFYRAFLGALPSFGLGRFAALVEGRLPGLNRHLRAALDLSAGASPPGASGAFVARHLEATADLLGLEARPAFLSFGAAATKKRLAAFASGLCAAGVFAWAAPGAASGLLHPFSAAPLESIMDIRPGNTGLFRGSACKIEAAWSGGTGWAGKADPGLLQAAGGQQAPELFLKSPGAGWAGVPMAAAARGRFEYEVEELGEDLIYRLRYKGLESAAYRIKALDAPFLKEPVFSVSPPAYTGAPRTDLPYLPAETEVLKGSLVSISGTCALELAAAGLVFPASGLKKPFVLSGGRLTAGFPVFEDVSYRLELEAADGLSAQPPGDDGRAPGAQVRLIKAREDAPPEITVLSPVFPQLEAAPQEEIAGIYEAGDDLGLAEITLERKVFVNGQADAELSFSRSVRSFSGPAVRSYPGETPLELYDLPDGARAEFHFRVCDRLPGRLCPKSGPVNIKVVDFDARHAAAYARFEALRRSATALKAKEDELIERLAASTGTFTEAELQQLAAAWKALAEESGQAGNALNDDPYAAAGALERYGLVKRDLDHGARSALEKAIPETRAGRAGEALKDHKKLSGTLGAGIRELEAMLRSEDARSSAFGFESMEQTAEAMAENLAGGGPASEGDWKKLERTLAKIASELARINELLKDRPPRPDGGKTFSLPSESAAGTAGELSRALARRDAAKAAELAAQLAKTLARMRRVMEEYSAYQEQQNGGGGENKAVNELADAWKALQEAQSAEVTAGRAFEEQVFSKTEKAKAAAFAELTALQETAAAKMAIFKTVNPAAHAAALEAAARLKARDLEGARRLLEQAAFELKKSTAPGSPAPAPGAQAAALEEERAAALAGKLGSDAAFLEQPDLALFGPAAKRQDEIEAGSGRLYARIEGGYSGELAAKLLDKLGNAREHMRAASAALTANAIRTAVPSQLKALEELELGGEDLDNMLQSLQQAQAAGGAKGRPAGTFTRPAGGTNVSPVKLPRPGDYVPPEDLRRKVMDSLRERYPAASKELIEDYFKGITK